MELAGVTIYVRDWAAAVAWYRDVLGLTVGPYEPDDEFCMLLAGSGFIALATDHPEFAQGTHENRLSPTIRVDDLDETVRVLRERGVVVEDRIEGEDEGYRLTRAWDLEGNRINLFSSS